MENLFNAEYPENDYRNYLEHHGILGMRWGVRRYQNSDGSLTTAGKKHYSSEEKATRIQKNNQSDLAKTYSRTKNSGNPYTVSKEFEEKAKNLIKESYAKNKKSLDDAMDKYIEAVNQSDKYEREFDKLCEKYGKEYYKSELKGNEEYYNTEREKSKLYDYSVYEYGYEKAMEKHPDVFSKAYFGQDDAWDNYKEACKQVVRDSSGLGSSSFNKTIHKDGQRSLSLGDAVSDVVSQMHSEDRRNKKR